MIFLYVYSIEIRELYVLIRFTNDSFFLIINELSIIFIYRLYYTSVVVNSVF